MRLCFCAIATTAVILLAGCAAPEPRPAGISRFISFTVSPFYPRSFEITAVSYRSVYGHSGVEELKEAWRKKALLVANGKKFKASSLVVHDNESVPYGSWGVQTRSVTGTITLTD